MVQDASKPLDQVQNSFLRSPISPVPVTFHAKKKSKNPVMQYSTRTTSPLNFIARCSSRECCKVHAWWRRRRREACHSFGGACAIVREDHPFQGARVDSRGNAVGDPDKVQQKKRMEEKDASAHELDSPFRLRLLPRVVSRPEIPDMQRTTR